MNDKKKKKKRFDVSKFINLKPMMNERKSNTAVIAFGRFNPITIGHEKLVNKLTSEAKKRNATPLLFASHSQDKRKNPLSYDSKIAYMKKAFGRIVQKTAARNIIEIAKELEKNFDHLVFVAGSDRVSGFQQLLDTYNGREFHFESIEVISAGERDPDASDVSGMSASKMRSFASIGNIDEFKKGLPRRLQSDAMKIYTEIRKNMGIHEDMEELEEELLNEREPLTLQQRRQRAITMRRYKTKIAAARRRMKRRKATTDKLKQRARRKARNIIRQRFLRGRSYGELSPSEKIQIDKRVMRLPDAMINRMATRQLPIVRKAEMERLSKVTQQKKKNESLNDAFENYLIERRECPPKRFHMAMTKEGKVKFDKRFKFFRKEPVKDLAEFVEDVFDLMEHVEEFVEAKGLDKSADDQCWDDYVQLGMKKKGKKEVPNCVPKESIDASKPSNREHGTSTLVKILKRDTPGEKNESYYSSDILSPGEVDFSALKKGARVRFSAHSMDMNDDEEREGTIIGSNVSHLRVRDDAGILYRVRHGDATDISESSELDEDFELRFMKENAIARLVGDIHTRVSKGQDLDKAAWDVSSNTGFKITARDLIKQYEKTHADAVNKMKVSPEKRRMLMKKYT